MTEWLQLVYKCKVVLAGLRNKLIAEQDNTYRLDKGAAHCCVCTELGPEAANCRTLSLSELLVDFK